MSSDETQLAAWEKEDKAAIKDRQQQADLYQSALDGVNKLERKLGATTTTLQRRCPPAIPTTPRLRTSKARSATCNRSF
jgi:hypothetical protein